MSPVTIAALLLLSVVVAFHFALDDFSTKSIGKEVEHDGEAGV